MPERTFVIVGAGLAGATAAATLRDEGFEGRIVLLGEEPVLPYERPPLSKEYLRGEQDLEQALVRPAEWYEERDIDVRLDARVERIDPRGEVVLPGTGSVAFDALLVATGARNRRLGVPGADLPGVLDLRTVADADLIRAGAEAGARVLVVGMGFIGSEVAASLRETGSEVTAVEMVPTPLLQVVGPEVGEIVGAMHRDHGVDLVLGDGVERFVGSGRVEGAVTSSGRTIECDVAVVGVGVVPSVETMAGSGMETPDGIPVDATLRTAFPNVFAAGDVALHDHPVFGRVRVEHFDNALKMGQAAARNMLGREEPFADAHWFWSDQYDVNLQMAGVAARWDRVVFRGDLQERSFSAFYLRQGVLVSALSMNRPRDVRRAMPLIVARATPDPVELSDPEVDLRTLALPAA